MLAFAVSGALSGALRQLVQVAALVAGWLAANAWGGALAVRVFGAQPWPWQRALSGGLCFVGGPCWRSAWWGASWRRGWPGRAASRAPATAGWGRCSGAVKGGLLAWLLLSVLVRVSPLALGELPAWTPPAPSSARWRPATTCSAPSSRSRRAAWTCILEAVRDPAARERLIQSDPGLKKLLEDPRLKPLLEKLAGPGGQPGTGAAPGQAPAPDGSSTLEELLQRLKGEDPGK